MNSDAKKQRVNKNVTDEYSNNEEADIIELDMPKDTSEKIATVNNKKNTHKLESIKVIGDMECEYHVYVEDYVYTYIYQLAAVDLAKESSAVLIGEIFSDSKEAIVRAVIPVDMDKLGEGAEWIDMSVVEEIEEQRKSYFANQDIIGWMHMQPGYGTMLTMKELREHQNVFEGNGTLCLLVDAINKIETMFVYEDEELKEQSGYCMYYERNEEMQQYMLDHPFTAGTKEEMKDTVVNQFREIGKIRKAEYAQRKNLNLTVMAASIILIALTAVIVKMNDNKSYVDASGSMQQTANIEEGNTNLDENDFLTEPALTQVNNDAQGNDDSQMTTDDVNTLGESVLNNNEQVALETQEAEGNVSNEQQAGNESVASSDNEEQAVITGDYDTYTVETGDTLADICYKQYGSAERSMEVAKFNGLSNTNQIYVGQELKMPK